MRGWEAPSQTILLFPTVQIRQMKESQRNPKNPGIASGFLGPQVPVCGDELFVGPGQQLIIALHQSKQDYFVPLSLREILQENTIFHGQAYGFL